MRTLMVRDADGGLDRYAHETIVATTHFHDDEESRAQAFGLLKGERARAERMGFDRWEPTALSQTLIDRANDKAGRRVACAATTLALYHIINTGRGRRTLYEAANTVRRAMKETKKDFGHAFSKIRMDSGELALEPMAPPSGREDIAKAHRSFEPVSHILAAELLCMDYFHFTDTYGRTDNQILAVLATAARIERTILAAEPGRLRNHYRIDGFMPVGSEDFPALDLTDGTLAFIESGMKQRTSA